MAPSFDNLREDDDGYDSADDLDFSGRFLRATAVSSSRQLTYCFADLRESYDVRLEQGLDGFTIVDGLPIVTTENKSKLEKYIKGKLSTPAFKLKEDGFFMPLNESGKSEGYDNLHALEGHELNIAAMLSQSIRPRNKPSLHAKQYMVRQLTRNTPLASTRSQT